MLLIQSVVRPCVMGRVSSGSVCSHQSRSDSGAQTRTIMKDDVLCLDSPEVEREKGKGRSTVHDS